MANDSKRRRPLWKWGVLNLLIALAGLLLLEGVASVVQVVREMKFAPLAARLYTGYDAELGWVGLPNYDLADLYGPGVYLRTNSLGLRNNEDFGKAVPEGRGRLLCSGDSFTLGYGVDNDHTWPAQVAQQLPRLQAVNLGQGGYGVDQSYLLYQRLREELDFDVHLFAFVTYDFDRMERTVFSGYGKPRLRLQEGDLQVTNVPVPESSYSLPWLGRNVKTLQKLALVEMTRDLLALEEVNPAQDEQLQETQQLAAEVFRRLHRAHEDQGTPLVLIHLPTLRDYFGNPSEHWQSFLHRRAQEEGWRYLDLIQELRTIKNSKTVRSFFIRPGEIDYPGAAGHYTNAGNAFIAQAIVRRLARLPAVAVKLR